VLISGCDPTGLRQVQLQLQYPPTSEAATISLDSPNTQQALQVLDEIVVHHGFRLVANYSNQSEHGYIRVYTFSFPPTMIDGQSFTRTIPIHVRLTNTGLNLTFGELGFLGGNSNAESVFVDVRSTFERKYGNSNVKSNRSGHPLD
jgi:hypothetical protein